MRHRIRESAAVDYQVVRRNTEWPDHVARTLLTAGLIAWLEPKSILDPACGDASLVFAADRMVQTIPRADLIDISMPGIESVQKQIRDRWDVMHDRGWDDGGTWVSAALDAGEFLSRAAFAGRRWDVIVLTEFLEHVDNPDQILEVARRVAKFVVASSPLVNSPHDDDSNPEHLWAFDNQGYADMLTGAGWTPMVRNNLMFRDFQYAYQVWVARA